jgi:hypothetical protein
MKAKTGVHGSSSGKWIVYMQKTANSQGQHFNQNG